MDVEELLNYQPSSSIEKVNKEGSSQDRKTKKLKLDVELDSDTINGPLPLDEVSLKKLLLNFERKVLKNQEYRIKFADDATKFMDTEVELFDMIQEMHVISTQPELYHFLVDLNVLSTILGLLSHENTDIACAVVALIQELSDLDSVEDVDDVSTLLDALIEGQIISLLVSNMERLDESVKEEAEGVYNSLAIIENLTDYKPQLCKDCQSLITWILMRLKAKIPFDGNKLYASEILSILLQNNDDNRKYLGSLDGIDTLLQQIAYYKRHDLSSADEREYMENIFDCLCSSLLCCSNNRELFYKGEGIELMNLILKDKKKKGSNNSIRIGALKVINHALSEDKQTDNILSECCNKFIEVYGLRSLFPIFMKPRSIVVGQKKEARSALDEVEEHCLSIILSLLKHSKPDLQKRVVNKFLESDLEKTERLVELHLKFYERLVKVDNAIKREKQEKKENGDSIDEDSYFMKRLAEGLYTLQLVDHIILLLSNFDLKEVKVEKGETKQESNEIKEKVMKLLGLHASGPVNHYKSIKQVMSEMAEEKDREEKEKILELISNF